MATDRNLTTSNRKGFRNVQSIWSAGCRYGCQSRVVTTRIDLAADAFDFRCFSLRRQYPVEAADVGVCRDALGLGRRNNAEEAVCHGPEVGGQAVSPATRSGQNLSGFHQGTRPMDCEVVRSHSAALSADDATVRRVVLDRCRLGGLCRRWKSRRDAADEGQRGPFPRNEEEKAKATKPQRQGAPSEEGVPPSGPAQDQGPRRCEEFGCQEEAKAIRRSSDLVDPAVARGPGNGGRSIRANGRIC